MALLAIVAGAAFGLRSGFDDTPPEDTTQVAGNVIERSEPAVAGEAPVVDDDPIVIPVPAPDRDTAAGEDTDQDLEAPPAAAPAPAPADEPRVGIVRDNPPPALPADPDDSDDDAGSGSDGEADNDEPAPRRRPRRNPPSPPRPTPSPSPEHTAPTPTPQPEDVALRTGEGHSRDTAIADNGEWLFREVSGHGGQGGDSSREAQARVVVAFNAAAKQGTGVVRSFACEAWVTAGEGRLTTDTDHVFEVALLAVDADGNVLDTVTSVLERHAYDLAPGQSTQDTPMSTTPVELSAEDGVNYTCGVRYRDR